MPIHHKTQDKAAVVGGLLILAVCAAVGCGTVQPGGSDAGGGSPDGSDAGGGSPDGGDAGGGETSAFSLSVPAEPVEIRQAGFADVEVTVERMNGFEGDVTVTLSDLPPGMSADSITIPTGEITGSLAIAAAENASDGQAHSLTIEGTAGELSDTAALDIFVVGLAGSLDDSYGDGGRQLIEFPAGAILSTMVRQPDGKLVLGGSAGDAMIVVRVHEDGTLDTGFATNGTATVDFTALGVPDVGQVSVALQSDGKIVAAGYGDSDPDPDLYDFDIVLARLDASGNLDDTFADGGKIAHGFGSASARANHVVTDEDDRIVVVGNTRPSGNLSSSSDWFAARFTADGALDSAFDGDGSRQDDGDTFDSSFHAVVRPNGSLAVYSTMMDSSAFITKTVLLSYQPDGSPDGGFGTGGRVVMESLDGQRPALRRLLLQQDGRLIGAGALGSAPAVFRFTVTGALDPGWSDDGHAGIPLQSDETGSFLAALDTDDGVVAVSLTSPPDRLTLARFASDGTLDTTFGDSGVFRHAHGLTSDELTGVVEVDRSRVLVLVSGREGQGDRLRYFFRVWL